MYYEYRYSNKLLSANVLGGFDRSRLKTAFRTVNRLLEFSGHS